MNPYQKERRKRVGLAWREGGNLESDFEQSSRVLSMAFEQQEMWHEVFLQDIKKKIRTKVCTSILFFAKKYGLIFFR